MERVPVGKSIAGGYAFLFGRFFTIVGLSWLPAALYAVMRLAFLHHAAPFMANMTPGHPFQISPAAHALHLIFMLLSLLLISVIAIALSSEALGLRNERVAAHLVIGARELRLFIAFILIGLIMIVTIIALIAAVCAVHWGVEKALAMWAQNTMLAQWPVLHAVTAIAILIALFVALFVGLRLRFLIAPIAAAEHHASLRRSWELSAGNFWRMLAITLALGIPLLIVLLAAQCAVLGAPFHDAIFAAIREHRHPDRAVFFSLMMQHAAALAAISAAGLVVVIALFAGASAVAYRALVPPPSSDDTSQAPAPETPPPSMHARFEPAPMHMEEPPAGMHTEEMHTHEAEASAEHAAAPEAELDHEQIVEPAAEIHAEAPLETHAAAEEVSEPVVELNEAQAEEPPHH